MSEPRSLEPLSYQSRLVGPPLRSRGRVAALLGLASVPLVLVLPPAGFVLGLVSLIGGIAALRAISRGPSTYYGTGYGLAGIIAGIISLAGGILVPSACGCGGSRELSNRAVCAANMRGIMQSLVVYAENNNGDFPYSGSSPVSAYAVTGGNQSAMGAMFNLVTPNTGLTPNLGTAQCAPKSFLCKSDPANTAPAVLGGNVAYWNGATGADFSYSYSFAYPFSSPDTFGPWWRNTPDASLALVADMNPGGQHVGSNPNRNSLNHQGDGQNIGYADGHAEFQRTPLAGQKNDHIYNLNSKAAADAGTSGIAFSTLPDGDKPGTFDVCLVPALKNSTNYARE